MAAGRPWRMRERADAAPGGRGTGATRDRADTALGRHGAGPTRERVDA
ncbi:hypothetical protein [Streptomyces malaysiensis]